MSDNAQDRRGLLRQEGSDLSDASIASPIHQRHGYQRMDSQGQYAEPAPTYTSPTISINEFGGLDHGSTGLGIREQPVSILRRPLPHQTPSPETPSNTFTPSSNRSPANAPGSSNPLLSPAWQRQSGEFAGMGQMRDQGLGGSPRKATFVDSPDVALRDRGYDNDNDNLKLLHEGCPAKHDIHSSRKSWLSISILLLSTYSTVFSAIWLILAMMGPRYGRMIHSGGAITPATASIIFALLAKTIELSFVTVFVTFLGQVLSRRSLVKQSRGVTIAELTLRTWVIQPGFMITHGQYLKHAAVTVLGAITLTAAFVAMFYTTASDAIVSPHLKVGRPEVRVMGGNVKTSYANAAYIIDNCRTPVSKITDPDFYGSTCLAIEHAGAAYHDSITFMDTWSQISRTGISVPLNITIPWVTTRPRAPAMMFDNTTVSGSWVFGNTSNMTAASELHNGRIINNVTLSMPHAGVYAAAKDPRNGILQPSDLNGLGEYSVRASVVSPSLNVLCVNMNQSELAPLIYTEWPNSRKVNSSTNSARKWAAVDWLNDVQNISVDHKFLNSTIVDDIFMWGKNYSRLPPVFPQWPTDYNSVTNPSVVGSDSIYLLIKGSAAVQKSTYTVCQIRSFLNPFCSTTYNVSGLNGGHLESHCSDSDATSDLMAYSKSVPKYPTNASDWVQNDWRDLAREWILSISLNTGVSDANSSTSRFLANLIPTPSWDGSVKMRGLVPTIAEALAVMGGNTLLMGSTDATFHHFWGSEVNIVEGIWEEFDATVTSQQYTSGLEQRWQGMFYVVLLLVFVTNVVCLVYFFLRSGLVTDYTEPQNLFALAVNSPPSERLSGSCGAGPEGDQLNVDWHVLADESTGHFLIKEGEPRGKEFEMRTRRERDPGRNLKSMSSYTRLSSKRHSWL